MECTPVHTPTCDINTCNCYEGFAYIENALEDLDKELKEKLTPKGANKKISKQPRVNANESQLGEGIEFFEKLLEDYAGMLLATPVGDRPFEEDALYEEEEGDWEWYYVEYYYYYEEEDQQIDEEDKNALALSFLDVLIAYMLEATSDLILKKTSIQKWTTDTRENIINGTIAQYMLGIGGKHVIGKSDVKAIEALTKAQLTFFQKFAEEIRKGDLTGARILQRVGMYAEATTHGYEQAKARSHGIVLPEYPGDGNQICMTNCRCRWVLKDDTKDTDYVLATWTLNPLAEHCQSCIDNAKKWKPLRVKRRW